LNGQASTTQFSATKIYVGSTATTTIRGDGGTSAFAGDITIPAGNGIDTASGGAAITIGGANASSITIGRSTIITTFPGILAVASTTGTSTFAYGINITGGGCFAIAGTCVGSSTGATLSANNTWTGTQTFGPALLFSGMAGIDTNSAVSLYIGTSSASAVKIGRSSATTTILGGFAVASTTATSSFSYGINLPTGGCFAIASVCVGSSTGATLSANNTWTGTQTFAGSATTTFGGSIGFTGPFGIDTTIAAPLHVGTSTASAITIGRSGNTTTFPGTVQANGATILGSVGTAINSLVFGYCNISNPGSVSGTSSAYFTCGAATGVTTSHRVFIQATSSLGASFIVQAASSTAGGVISLLVYNTSNTSQSVPATSLNFFGIQ
jgi:hypothetical protein